MTKTKKFTALHISLYIVLAAVVIAATIAIWLCYHYKQVLRQQLPSLIERSSDSVYHISYSDIGVSLFDHTITITGLHIWPDTARAKILKEQHRPTPPTLSVITIPRLEAHGLIWKNLIAGRSLDCEHVIVNHMKWLLACTPRPPDPLLVKSTKTASYLNAINVSRVDLLDPNITYHFKGRRGSFFCFMKGGSATLNDWVYNFDRSRDTSVFLFAHSGKVRLDSFIFLKTEGRYTVKKPMLDFETAPGKVVLNNIQIGKLVDRDPATGEVKEIYNLDFPLIELQHFNWNRLIYDNTLAIAKVSAHNPHIDFHYMRQSTGTKNKMGSYPHQLLLQAGLNIDIHEFYIQNGDIKYTEVVHKGSEGLISFSAINGSFTNITNISSAIAKDSICTIKLDGSFLGKSPVSTVFQLQLSDTLGHFTMDGVVKDIDGDDINKQARAFTLVEVTSFYLSRMDIHEEGDQTFAKGTFAVQYRDLKISLLKFKSNHRKGKKGPLSFLGSALLLYPSNPMPGTGVRKVTTAFPRDPEKGFINLVWKNIYRGAKKTALRDDRLLDITDGKESTSPPATRKRGLLHRLFEKKTHE